MRSTVIVLMVVALLGGCAAQPSRPPQIVAAGGLVYPPEAAAKHIQGYVVVSYDVTADGTVANARVVEAQPPGVFDEAALVAVRGWQFNAASDNGRLVATMGLTSRVEFKLDNSEAYAR